MVKLFSRFFPTPDFLSMKAVGLAITDTAIRFVEFDASSHRREVVQRGHVPLEKGVVERGLVNDPAKLAQALKKVQGLTGSSFVAAAIPDEKAYVYKVRVPISKDRKAIQNSVEATIEENAPLRLEQVTFDFDIVRTHKAVSAGEKEHLDIVVSVVPMNVVEMYISAFESAGFLPVSFELESHAVAKAVVAREEKETLIIIHIDDAKTALYIVSDGLVQFSSSVEHESDRSILIARSGSKLTDEMHSIQQELKKIYSYWNNQVLAEATSKKKEQKQIMKVIVSGEKAADDQVIDQIERISPVQVQRANVWTNAFSFEEYIPDIPLKDSLGFATAVGLALSASQDGRA